MKHATTFLLASFLAVTLVWLARADDSKTRSQQSDQRASAVPSGEAHLLAPNIRRVKQGFSMKVQLENTGVTGHYAYGANAPNDSIGLEYPLGQRIEHLYGGGIWIGGKLDTTALGQSGPQLKLVSTSYEGWGAVQELREFYPGGSAADTFWVFRSKNAPKPLGWDAYWEGALPFNLISDNDVYCTYTDTGRLPLTNHVPMRLKVIQSSYAWNDPYADAIIIFEYKIVNLGRKVIDSAYVGVFADCDVGPITARDYALHNYTAYDPVSHTAYIHNPLDRGSTPMGVTLLNTSDRRLDSLRYSFQWYPGPETPQSDAAKYDLMSVGGVRPNEYPSLSDTRFLFSFGPFTFKPTNGLFGPPDTLKVAVAYVSGFSRRHSHIVEMLNNASKALNIYINQGIQLPFTPPSPPLKVEVGQKRVTLNWQWTTEDVLRGWPYPDPVLNWDSTNRVAERDPYRTSNPPPGYERGGRNFEAYRVWRSEHPNHPDDSFTLLAQYDDSLETVKWEYDTGLRHTFVDSNLVRGKTYVYAVTSKSIPNIAVIPNPNGGNDTVTVNPLESSKQINATVVQLPFAVSNDLGKVSVVPNPYRTDFDYTLESGGWEGLSSQWRETYRLIKFINLPPKCKIRIFTLSGDLVREVDHDGTTEAYPRGDHDVSLLSESNRALASGIYIFTVESEFGTQTGKFVIIR
jgi:hypothetical protein